jgi:hypothetical protein
MRRSREEVACIQESNNLYNKLKNRLELTGIVTLNPKNRNHYSFQVKFVSELNFEDMDGDLVTITGMSISYCHYTTGNRGPEMGDPTIPQTIETALKSGDSFCYVDEINYADGCKFSSENEIVEELIRIAKFREANM